jgi:hypothetical protein
MKFFAYQSKFRENLFPIFVITNEDPKLEKDWNHPSYERIFLGVFDTYEEAIEKFQMLEPNFCNWEKLDDSYLQGETVFVKS